MSIFDDYIRALASNTPKHKAVVYFLRTLFQFVFRDALKRDKPESIQERIACVAYTIGYMAAKNMCAGKELHLVSWLSKASEQDINAIFEESESVN